jgi:hypothetical protein
MLKSIISQMTPLAQGLKIRFIVIFDVSIKMGDRQNDLIGTAREPTFAVSRSTAVCLDAASTFVQAAFVNAFATIISPKKNLRSDLLPVFHVFLVIDWHSNHTLHAAGAYIFSR